MKLTRNLILTNLGLVAAAVAIILFLLPHDDRQSYNYELNQPWRYQLLTADFDMPILRDSTSAREMRDSIDRVFVPFVKRDDQIAKKAVAKLSSSLQGHASAAEQRTLAQLMSAAYTRGIVSADIYDRIHGGAHGVVRIDDGTDAEHSVTTVDASEMLSPPRAFKFIDSVYRAANPNAPINDEAARILGEAITPNIIIDKESDSKYREQEYLTVNGAMGVIKKGQRIVDRGEIITPQIFTNLNTYTEIATRNHQTDNSTTYFLLGQGLYTLLCFVALYVYLGICRPKFLAKTRNMVFLISFITIFEAFAILMFEFVGNGIYFVPFAAIPIVTGVFYDSRTAIFSLLITVMIATLVAVFPFQFIFMELAAGLTAAFSINNLERRSELLRTAILTFLAYAVSYTISLLITDGRLSGFDWHLIGAFGINAIVLSFAYFIILIVEKVFGFTSTVTLVELSDINNKLLRRLAEEAPGTFQHSMQVSTLAAEAARAIGANTQLVRTGALYHDIGKLDGPIFFTENQHGVNPHTGLNPQTSAHKIISHVTSGLAIAQQAKLPEVIRHFITEHHGRAVTRYFYNTAVNENPDGEVNREEFTYPGPNPHSRETAILMMADSVEAASRSLPQYSPEAIDKLVDKIIDTQEKEGLFNESPISFRDIQTIKDTFKKRLSTIYHSRVAYPDLKKGKEQDKVSQD
ncbi:MAG: HDIG domain-containing protein [Muribaculaceae bacterium]|nr:HDIG domain-containing protein [Muribaculaceae bacterium]